MRPCFLNKPPKPKDEITAVAQEVKKTPVDSKDTHEAVHQGTKETKRESASTAKLPTLQGSTIAFPAMTVKERENHEAAILYAVKNNMTGLLELNERWTKLGLENVFKELAKAKLTNLNTIIVNNLALSSEQVSILCKLLPINPWIMTLKLVNCDISDVGGRDIVKALDNQNSNKTNTLDLSGNCLGTKTALAIRNFLQNRQKPLVRMNLCLQNNMFDKKDYDYIYEGLTKAAVFNPSGTKTPFHVSIGNDSNKSCLVRSRAAICPCITKDTGDKFIRLLTTSTLEQLELGDFTASTSEELCTALKDWVTIFQAQEKVCSVAGFYLRIPLSRSLNIVLSDVWEFDRQYQLDPQNALTMLEKNLREEQGHQFRDQFSQIRILFLRRMIYQRFLPAIKTIIDYSTDKELSAGFGDAVLYGYREAAELIIQKKGWGVVEDEVFYDGFYCIIQNQRLELLPLFFQRDEKLAGYLEQFEKGRQLLSQAVQHGSFELVKLLLNFIQTKKNAEVILAVRNSMGLTAENAAEKLGYFEIMRLFGDVRKYLSKRTKSDLGDKSSESKADGASTAVTDSQLPSSHASVGVPAKPGESSANAKRKKRKKANKEKAKGLNVVSGQAEGSKEAEKEKPTAKFEQLEEKLRQEFEAKLQQTIQKQQQATQEHLQQLEEKNSIALKALQSSSPPEVKNEAKVQQIAEGQILQPKIEVLKDELSKQLEDKMRQEYEAKLRDLTEKQKQATQVQLQQIEEKFSAKIDTLLAVQLQTQQKTQEGDTQVTNQQTPSTREGMRSEMTFEEQSLSTNETHTLQPSSYISTGTAAQFYPQQPTGEASNNVFYAGQILPPNTFYYFDVFNGIVFFNSCLFAGGEVDEFGNTFICFLDLATGNIFFRNPYDSHYYNTPYILNPAPIDRLSTEPKEFLGKSKTAPVQEETPLQGQAAFFPPLINIPVGASTFESMYTVSMEPNEFEANVGVQQIRNNL